MESTIYDSQNNEQQVILDEGFNKESAYILNNSYQFQLYNQSNSNFNNSLQQQPDTSKELYPKTFNNLLLNTNKFKFNYSDKTSQNYQNYTENNTSNALSTNFSQNLDKLYDLDSINKLNDPDQDYQNIEIKLYNQILFALLFGITLITALALYLKQRYCRKQQNINDVTSRTQSNMQTIGQTQTQSNVHYEIVKDKNSRKQSQYQNLSKQRLSSEGIEEMTRKKLFQQSQDMKNNIKLPYFQTKEKRFDSSSSYLNQSSSGFSKPVQITIENESSSLINNNHQNAGVGPANSPNTYNKFFRDFQKSGISKNSESINQDSYEQFNYNSNSDNINNLGFRGSKSNSIDKRAQNKSSNIK
eukprot:403354506